MLDFSEFQGRQDHRQSEAKAEWCWKKKKKRFDFNIIIVTMIYNSFVKNTH